MKKKTLFLFLVVYNLYYTQEIESLRVIDSTEKNVFYHKYRIENTTPSYSLSKIEKIISKLDTIYMSEEYEKEKDNYCVSLSEKYFDKLTVKEKFTYTMIHPECISQGYSDDTIISDEENKIFADLPHTKNEAIWSEKQRTFLRKNRKEILTLIKESSLKNKRIGLNFKKTVFEIDGIEIIPFLIDFYSTKDIKDKDILTLLMLLVKKNKYYPFARSNIYRSLYSDNKPYHEVYVDYSKVNEEYILKTANNFFLQSPKKK